VAGVAGSAAHGLPHHDRPHTPHRGRDAAGAVGIEVVVRPVRTPQLNPGEERWRGRTQDVAATRADPSLDDPATHAVCCSRNRWPMGESLPPTRSQRRSQRAPRAWDCDGSSFCSFAASISSPIVSDTCHCSQ